MQVSLPLGRDLVHDFAEFGRLNVLEGLAALLELLEGLDDRLGQAFVGFRGTADDGELVAGRYALMAVVVVEAQPQEPGGRPGFFSLFGHAGTVSGLGRVSSRFSSTASQTMSVKASSWL